MDLIVRQIWSFKQIIEMVNGDLEHPLEVIEGTATNLRRNLSRLNAVAVC
jgi:hypothetical protein